MVFKWAMPFTLAAAGCRSVFAKLAGFRVLTTPEEQDQRLAHCHRCSHLVDGQCNLCACFVEAKTALTMEECPIKRWKRIWHRRPK